MISRQSHPREGAVTLCVTDAGTKAREGGRGDHSRATEPERKCPGAWFLHTPPSPVQTSQGMGSGPSLARGGHGHGPLGASGRASCPEGPQRRENRPRCWRKAGPGGLGHMRSLLSAKDRPLGKIPHVHRALPLRAASRERWPCLSLLSPPIPEPQLSPPGRASLPSCLSPPGSPRFSVPSSVKAPCTRRS